jgi:hypothetical protein
MAVVTRRMTLLLLAFALASPILCAAEPPAETSIDLTPRVGPNDLAQVTIELECGGTMQARENDEAKGEVKTLPMSVSAKLVYDEHRVAPTAGNLAKRAIRYYDEAAAVIKVENGGLTPKLGDDHRLVVAENPGGRLSFAAAQGQLDRQELDLIDVTGDTLAIDGLLPNRPVSPNATWSADPNTMAAILSMDSVAAAQVENVLDKFNSDFALVRIAGAVVGTADGSTTEMEVRGVYLFDRKLERITRFNLAVKEKRSIGGATPGLDGVAKLRVNVQPIESSANLAPAAIASVQSSHRLQLDMLRLEPEKQGFRVLHDRRWIVTNNDRESTTLRRVEGGDVLAQCTITSLPSKSAGRQTTLDEFERDIRLALKDNFGELVSSRQWANTFGHHCLEVIVRGTADSVPIEWHYYLVAPDAGNRVSIAVTIQGENVNRLAAADRTLVNALELLPAGAAQTAARAGVSR